MKQIVYDQNAHTANFTPQNRIAVRLLVINLFHRTVARKSPYLCKKKVFENDRSKGAVC